MPDPIYVDSIKVSAGPFTVSTSSYEQRTIIKRHLIGAARSNEWHMKLEDLALLHRTIGEYLHMRGMEDA